LNIWRQAGIIIIFLGIAGILLGAFPVVLPDADLSVGPLQILAVMSGFAVLMFGLDVFRSVTRAAAFSRQYIVAYGFWLAGPSLNYLTFRFFPALHVDAS
jgi:hypothetical protein